MKSAVKSEQRLSKPVKTAVKPEQRLSEPVKNAETTSHIPGILRNRQSRFRHQAAQIESRRLCYGELLAQIVFYVVYRTDTAVGHPGDIFRIKNRLLP